MADDPKNPLSPFVLTQNPAPFPESGQDFQDKVRVQTNAIMTQFMKVLPSNYVAQVTGPFYTLQFQAAAEQLALFQLVAEEVFKDSDYGYTRPDFLWQILGTFVFPGADPQSGVPVIEGDTAYRDFLKKMVILLLQGATAATQKEGIEFLTEAEVSLLERFLAAREPGSAWTIKDQFTFEVDVEKDDGTEFPNDPFTLSENVSIVLQALKPAHVLYSYRHLFRDAFGPLFSDTSSWELSTYYYDDLRKFCYGAQAISGVGGITLSGRMAFSDPTRSFASVQAGGLLHILSGVNEGHYRITEVVAFLVNVDLVARAYTTSPSGLAGTATVSGGVVTDAAQDFAGAVEGEVLTFTAGPNVGSYRLDTLLGSNGGQIGSTGATGPATSVRVSPSILRIETRMPQAISGQSYSVDVDRLGVKGPKVVVGEDASVQFYL